MVIIVSIYTVVVAFGAIFENDPTVKAIYLLAVMIGISAQAAVGK
jgi:hypothetical protein